MPTAEEPAWRYRSLKSADTWKGIFRDNAEDFTYIPVVIVGAGESGIAMGCRLKQALGFDQFRIFERQAGVGGTWWINRYPGVACDVPAVFYSFSFAQNPRWSEFYPPGAELAQYMHDVCAQFEILDKIQCNTEVQGSRWIEEEGLWETTLRHLVHGTGDLSNKDRAKKIEAEGASAVYIRTEKVKSKFVISAVGGLVEPNDWPVSVPGKEVFKGDIFHSARWRFDVDLHDKNVVVIGTGCSAAQFVPRLTKEPYGAKSVTQVMRSPPWVVPRAQPPGGEEMWVGWGPWMLEHVPGTMRLVRAIAFSVAESGFRLFGSSQFSAFERARLEKKIVRRTQRMTPSKYHEILKPDYGIGCKRLIYDAAWLKSLNDPLIELTTQPLTQLHEHSVTLGAGQQYPPAGQAKTSPAEREIPADVVVMANGFETQKWLHPLAVTGRDGVDLVDEMDRRGGPQAYQGTAMDGFPNFFIIFGPNTATGHSSVIMASENMVEHALQFMRPVLAGDARTVEVKRAAEERWTADLQRALKSTVWMAGGCSSWYSTDGWNGTVYPYSQVHFGYRCLFPTWSDWTITLTPQGKRRRLLRGLLRTLLLAATLAGVWKARRDGGPAVRGAGLRGVLAYWRNLLGVYVRTAAVELISRI